MSRRRQRHRSPERAAPPAAAESTASQRPLFLSIALVALTIAAFHPVWRFDFVAFDDPAYVLENAVVRRGLAWSGIVWAFANGYAANWHPLTWISHMIDVQFFGLRAGPHHVTSLALHIASVLMLFALLRRLTGATVRSAVVAALFAVHPLHVESVAWIAERKDVLSTFFLFLTVWAYAGYARQPRWDRYAAVVLCFALGLMAKSMLVTLPFVLLLLDWWPLRSGRSWRRLVLEKLPLFGLSAASSVITYVVQRAYGATRGQDVYSFAVRSANAVRSYAAYLGDVFWPAHLSVFYPVRMPIPPGQLSAAIALVAVVSLLAVLLARRAPYVIVGWLWYVGTLVPVIGLVQVGSQAKADRYTYVPLVGVFIAIVWGVTALVERRAVLRQTAVGAAAVVVLGCAVAAHAQVQHWQDGCTLWQQAVDVAPDDYRAQAALGVVLDRQRGDVGGAVAHLSEAARLRPDFVEARQNLALILVREGRVREAIPHFAEVVRLIPESAAAHSDLGRALSEAGRSDEAEAEFAAAARLEPNSEQAHFNLALALARSGRLAEAAREFGEVLRINPANQRARVAFDSLARRGKQ